MKKVKEDCGYLADCICSLFRPVKLKSKMDDAEVEEYYKNEHQAYIAAFSISEALILHRKSLTEKK